MRWINLLLENGVRGAIEAHERDAGAGFVLQQPGKVPAVLGNEYVVAEFVFDCSIWIQNVCGEELW